MKRRSLLLTVFVLLGSGLIAFPANALLIGVSGPNSSSGGAPAIISAPSSVLNDATSNVAMQGFNEEQDFVLPVGISVDGGGTIARGTAVDSHMIFLDPVDNGVFTTHLNVEWTFAGYILGTMSDMHGNLEIDSSGVLGAPGPPATTYPTALNFRGLEFTGDPAIDDALTISGNILRVSMHTSKPGDWIRVVTAAEPVPEPATMLLLGTGLVGLAGLRRKFKK